MRSAIAERTLVDQTPVVISGPPAWGEGSTTGRAPALTPSMAGSPQTSRFASPSLGFLLCGIESQSWHRALLRIKKHKFCVSALHSAGAQRTLVSVPRATACRDCDLTGYQILGRFLCVASLVLGTWQAT